MTIEQNINRLLMPLVSPFILIITVLLIVSLSTVGFARDLAKPKIILANIYHQGLDLSNYWVSEKLDGVRAYWDGKQLVSRGGNIYHAPDWFIADFPTQKLDGELWIARQNFELVVSTVRDKIPDERAWQEIKYMAFDVPDLETPFDDRLLQLETTIKTANIPWLRLVKQWRVSDHKTLMSQLETYIKAGAEGLMLHRGSSTYKGKRSGDLLKVKPYQDAEAVVIQHIEGKGKYKGMMGALVVRMPNDLEFKIGTGFSDKERQNPPAVGATVTYQYHGKTKNGVPRFASFLRIRKPDK